MKEHEIYKSNPDVIAFFAIRDGKVFFDINDNKISVPEMMVLNTNLINEYIKSIANMQNQQQKTE